MSHFSIGAEVLALGDVFWFDERALSQGVDPTEGTQAVSDSRDIRRVALMDKIPYFTTAAASVAAVAAMKARGEGYGVRTLQG